MKFFVSYSRSVKASVSGVIDELAKANHEIWWDGDIPVIGDWWETILKNIEACEVFIFMISEKAVQSDYCLAELRYAVALNIPMLPFIIDDCIVGGKLRYSIPDEINDSRVQWLNYDGNVKGMLSRINTGCSQINWAYYQRVPQNRPPEPNTGGETLTKQFQLAVTLADDGHFAEAIKRLRNVARLEPQRLGNLCHQWELKITEYRQIMEYADHKSTMKLARAEWTSYANQFKDDEEDLFDPFDIVGKLFSKEAQTRVIASNDLSKENRLATKPTPSSTRLLAEAAMPLGYQKVPPKQTTLQNTWQIPKQIDQLFMQGSEYEFDRAQLLRRAKVIEETLQILGAPGKVVEINAGSVVTQFGVEPDYIITRSEKYRVKAGAIAQLDKDLQMALGVKSIYIEAIVPGKGYVGIEIPNDTPSIVNLLYVMQSDEFKKIHKKSPLAIALGQSLNGTPIAADLSSMSNLLIAGIKDSDKSVCLRAIISCIIAMNPPDRVKFVLLDSKRIDLLDFNNIPHLFMPIVIEVEYMIGILKWVTEEIQERYKKLSATGTRNIEHFNESLQVGAERMPYIVVLISELADLMMLAPDETERVITRIAGKARATGIHLVIATQRPSVDVVTGLIKANFPARIAFAVAGRVDSRVILDQPGAERLLGKGDMFYISGDSATLERLQGVYISDEEVWKITEYWKSQININNTQSQIRPMIDTFDNNNELPQPEFWNTKVGSGGLNSDDKTSDLYENDVLYEEAVELVQRLGKASVSLLQRKLRIGYTRSARLIDRMEEEGIIGPALEGAKPREVLPKKNRLN